MGLLALVCVLIGVVTELALREFLIGQLDSQLQAAGGRSAAAVGHPPSDEGEGPGPNFLLAPGQPAGTLGAELNNGHVVRAGVLTSAGGEAAVPTAEQPVLLQLPVDGQPHTRRLRSLGDYRLLAARSPDGDVVVTGLPLGGVEATLVGLGTIMGLVAVVALVATGVAAALIVRVTLRPLRRVATTAARVAELPLDRGEIGLSVRVPEADTDPRTEVGQVGAASGVRSSWPSAAMRSCPAAAATRSRRSWRRPWTGSSRNQPA